VNDREELATSYMIVHPFENVKKRLKPTVYMPRLQAAPTLNSPSSPSGSQLEDPM
jgi:hypothetical protein